MRDDSPKDLRDPVKILVLGNCQVRTLANALELLVPSAEAQPFHLSNDPQILKSELASAFTNSWDLVLAHDSLMHIINAHDFLKELIPETTVVVPTITFTAFHPDIQYAFIGGEVVKNGLANDWNSRILLWAYRNGLSKDVAQGLFGKETFRVLGYLTEWSSSTAALQQNFALLGFDFSQWIRAVQRHGVFMHGINHPLPIAFHALTLQIVNKHLPNVSIRPGSSARYLTDHLAHIIWPVYPAVGDELGVDGSYVWRDAGRIVDLSEFIALCYDTWSSIGLAKQDVRLIPALTDVEEKNLRKLAGLEP